MSRPRRAGTAAGGRRRPSRAGQLAFALIGLIALTLLVSACGGSSGTPSSGGSKSGDVGVTYAACIRSHGVPNFPDPNSRGVIEIPSGIDPQSPQFQRAKQACQKLIPSNRTLTQQQQQQFSQQLLTFSQCMRTHGVPNFPDPNNQGNIAIAKGGGVVVSGSSIDQNSPQFLSAEEACRSLLPRVP